MVSGTVGKDIILFPVDINGDPIDMTEGDALKIGYRKPDGTEGTWDGTLETIDDIQAIVHTLENGDIPVSDYGQWTLYGLINCLPSLPYLTVIKRGISCST